MFLSSAIEGGEPLNYSLNEGSIRIRGQLDYLRPTTMPTASDNVSFCGWAKQKVVRSGGGLYTPIFEIGSPSGHTVEYIELITDTGGVDLYNLDHVSPYFHEYVMSLVLDEWVWFAVMIESGQMTTHYSRGFGPIRTVQTPITNITSYTPEVQNCTMGGTNFHSTEWFNGEMALCRIWDAQLTKAEFARERVATTAVRSADILGDWPLADLATFRNDVSGNGNNLQVVGGAGQILGGGINIST